MLEGSQDLANNPVSGGRNRPKPRACCTNPFLVTLSRAKGLELIDFVRFITSFRMTERPFFGFMQQASRRRNIQTLDWGLLASDLGFEKLDLGNSFRRLEPTRKIGRLFCEDACVRERKSCVTRYCQSKTIGGFRWQKIQRLP